jgi:hypothetical protein
MDFVILMGVSLLVSVPLSNAQSINRDSPAWLRFAAVSTDECPPDELSTLHTIIPLYIQWHFARHAEWLQDEVVDPILEAITKEEEGQEGTATGRGPVFRLLLAILQAADGVQAEQVRSGIPTHILLDTLRARAPARAQEVVRLQKLFTPHLTCLNEHRKAIEYLTELNQMPNFPDPIVNPAGTIGKFIGSFMRKHILVDHAAIIQGILIAGLNAHQHIQPSAKRLQTRAASLVLLERALGKVEPTIAAEVRQGSSKKALGKLLDGRMELKKKQEMVLQELKDSFNLLPKEYQEIFTVLVPSSSTRP